MANYSVTANTNVSLLDRLHDLLEMWKQDRAKARVFRTTRKELVSLTSRELADIGIARSEIYGIAYRAAYGEDAK